MATTAATRHFPDADTLLDQYPLPEAAWAKRATDPRLAQRFELYACGVELANACRASRKVWRPSSWVFAAAAWRRYGRRHWLRLVYVLEDRTKDLLAKSCAV